MALQDLLAAAHAKFENSFQTASVALAENEVFKEMAIPEARGSFLDAMALIFEADFQPILNSADSLDQKLGKLTVAFANQRVAYLASFSNEVDQNAAQAQSLTALKKSFRKIL